jgi:hypothetical protein
MVLLWRRGGRAYCVVIGVLLALCVLAAGSSGGVATALTLPWYRFPYRIADAVYVLAAPAIALGAVRLLARAPHRHALGGVLALVLLPPLSTLTLARAEGASTIGPDQIHAFQALAGTADDGTAVLTERRRDGGMWMYALTGTVPLFGFPVEYHEPGPYWRANEALLQAVADPSSDPRSVRDKAQRRCVGYVFVNEHPNSAEPGDLRRARLRAAPFLREELALATASVFRIDGVDLDDCVPEALR